MKRCRIDKKRGRAVQEFVRSAEHDSKQVDACGRTGRPRAQGLGNDLSLVSTRPSTAGSRFSSVSLPASLVLYEFGGPVIFKNCLKYLSNL